jgi:hypothetical protein
MLGDNLWHKAKKNNIFFAQKINVFLANRINQIANCFVNFLKFSFFNFIKNDAIFFVAPLHCAWSLLHTKYIMLRDLLTQKSVN